MSKDSDQIRAEIAATRGDLSANVNALTDSVKPSSVAKRQVEKVRGAAVSTRDRVMGSAPDLGSARDSTSSKAGDVASALGDKASSLSDTAGNVPQLMRRQTQGSPLAAGLIAFGAGLLVAALIPASEAEQQAAVAVKDKAEPLTTQLGDAAKQAGDHLREPAEQAVASLRQAATDGVEHTKQEGVNAGQQVKDDAQDAVGTVPDHQN